MNKEMKKIQYKRLDKIWDALMKESVRFEDAGDTYGHKAIEEAINQIEGVLHSLQTDIEQESA